MCDYLESRAAEDDSVKPFVAMLSWGTPHDPYNTAPPQYAALYPPDCSIELRPNVPPEFREEAARDLRGYYAHIAALDDCVARLLRTLDETGLASNTIVVFTSAQDLPSFCARTCLLIMMHFLYVGILTKRTRLCTIAGDHGDMIGCHGIRGKHVPWDESIRVPFLVRLPPSMPSSVAANGRAVPLLIDAPDIMPTLLSLCDLSVPSTVQGRDFSKVITGDQPVDPKMSSLLKVPVPYHLLRTQGITEFRGVRTMQHTYVRNIWGQWLLYDNINDPYQQTNLLAENVPTSVEREQVRTRVQFD